MSKLKINYACKLKIKYNKRDINHLPPTQSIQPDKPVFACPFSASCNSKT